MRIGIDARLFGLKHRGLGRYVQNLVEGLVEYDRQNDYVIFLTTENFDSFKTANPKVQKVLLNARWYSLKEQFVVPYILNKYRLDLVHFPHFNAPLFYRKKFMVTIHDLIIDHFPDSRATTLPLFLYKFKLLFYRLIVKHAVSRADKMIVPSGYVKQDLINLYHPKTEKIQVIHEGYFINQSNELADLKKFNLTKPYLIYVGAAYPHKNLERLIEAFSRLNSNDKYQLVLVGRIDYFYQKLIKQVKDRNVIFTGQVSDAELKELYRQAKVCVVPSLYEGFGFPGLEAQANGTPVVSADTSCLPEILGDSVVYFSPTEENQLKEKVLKVLNDQSLAENLIKKGYANILRFSLDKMIKQTFELYQK